MSTPSDTAPEVDYPIGDFDFYGHRGYLYSEGGCYVIGHGRRALACLNRMGRSEDGPGWYRPSSTTVRVLWAELHTRCGCTPEEHTAHAEEYGDCYSECEFPQLKPCGDEWDFVIVSTPEQKPGLLPIVEVKW